MNKSNQKNLIRTLFIALFVVVSQLIQAQIPEKPNPERLVNDYANIFTPSQEQELERALVMIDDSTSNQIVVVTVSDLAGYDPAYFAQQVGDTWGVGGKDYDNGIVILIKPKVGNSKGEVFIATGYGLEGAIPDATCNHITDNEMIPYFKQNDYYGGTIAGVSFLYRLAKGEIDIAKEKRKKGLGKLIFAIIFIVVMYIVYRKKGKNGGDDGHTSYGGFLPWLLLASMSSGRGGSGGSMGGSFGGFGGGGFGGGGAGGSW